MNCETSSAMKLYSVVSTISRPHQAERPFFLSIKIATQAVDLQTDQQQRAIT